MSQMSGVATKNDVGEAALYEPEIIAEHAPVAPPAWFVPALAAALVPALEAALGPALEAALGPALEAALGPALEATLVPALEAALVPALEAAIGPVLATVLAPLTRVAHISYNMQLGDGFTLSYMVVPFPNGDLPTAPPHNLPPLADVAAIKGLTEPQAIAYLLGYNRPVLQDHARRREAIMIEIGCTYME